jgi:pyruvate ferredoxin oxidoreductase gamma subunit
MNAFIRIDDKPIRIRSQVYEPDYVIVIDSTLMRGVDVFQGIKKNSIVVINDDKEHSPPQGLNISVYSIPANEIALKTIGKPLANTAILGALAATLDDLELENLLDAIKERFKKDIAEKNINSAKEGYNFVSKKYK